MEFRKVIIIGFSLIILFGVSSGVDYLFPPVPREKASAALGGQSSGQNIMSAQRSTVSTNLTAEDVAFLKDRGIDPDGVVFVSDPATVPITQHEPGALLYLEQFMGAENFSASVMMSDLIGIKPEQLKFRFGDRVYEYSGHYAIWILKARKHAESVFGGRKGSKANYVNIHSSGFDMAMVDATIWDKGPGFIDVEWKGQEFVCSGAFEIQE